MRLEDHRTGWSDDDPTTRRLMGPRARLALYVLATVSLPLAALGIAVLAVIDPDDVGTYQLVIAAAAVVAGIITYLNIRVTLGKTTHAVTAMTERARAVSAGHIGRFEPVPEDAPFELADLGRAFNDMFERVRSYVDELERSQGEFKRAINRLGDVFASTHDRTTIMDVALETSALVVGARTAVFWVVDGSHLVAARTYGEARVRERVAIGEGLAGAVAKDGWARIGEPEMRAPAEPHLEYAMAVAIADGDNETYGVVALYGRTTKSDFDGDDLATLQSFARQAEAAIVNTLLHEEAQLLAVTDGLTGLYNRREFERRAEEEHERAVRFGESFTVIEVDLDNFKTVNDTYGHPAGDAVLVEIARRLAEGTREVDVVARMGGEELVVLLPRTDLRGGVVTARKLRADVADTPVAIGDAGVLSVTASLGVASYPECGDDVGAVLSAADVALYRAKARGKDRVEAAARVAARPLRARRASQGGT